MPTEWPPKQPAPTSSGPDPAAVRAALAEIDATTAKFQEAARDVYGVSPESLEAYRAMRSAWAMGAWVIIPAARAWLAQQGEASE